MKMYHVIAESKAWKYIDILGPYEDIKEIKRGTDGK